MARKIPFDGDDAAYILFLEARVLHLEDSLRQSSQQFTYIGTSSSPADFNGVRNQNGVLERPYRPTRQIPIAPDTQSHDGDTEPAPEDFDEQRHIRKDGGNPDAFNFIEYNPTIHVDPNRTGKSAHDQSKKHQLKTLSRFISFIDNLPESEIWKDWVSALDEIQRKEFLEALVQNCGSSPSSFASLGTAKELAEVSSKSTDISILSQYASFMVSFGMLNKQLACFQNLVFVSLCAVALEKAEDKDGVYAVMRKVLGSDSSSKQLVKLVRGAKWANGLVSLLSKTKWASRSWDILCVAQRPVSFYARLNDCSVDPKEVLEKMGTNVHESRFSPESIDSPAPFAIPLIVKRVFKHSTSLKVICECLGYELSSVRSYQPLFKNALDDGHARKRLALTPYKPSKRHCPDHSSSPLNHQGQRAQCQSYRGVNITTEGSVLPEARDDDNSELMSQCQSRCQTSRGHTTPTTVFPQSEDITGQLSRVGPAKHSALSEDIAGRPPAVFPIPSSITRPPGTAEALSDFCPEPDAGTASVTSPCSKTPEHTLGETNVSEILHPTSMNSFLPLQQETLCQPLPSEIPFNPRDALYPASIDSLLSLQQETLCQPPPSEIPFNPRDALYPTSMDSFLPLQQETLCQPLPSEIPFNPRDALYPASIDSLLSLQQETLCQPPPSEIPFNPRDALYPTSMDSFLSLQQEMLSQPQPSEFPFNPKEALHTSSTALFPRAVGQASLPEQDATWRSDIMSDTSRTEKQPPPIFPSELQLGYRQNRLSSVSPSSC